MCSREKDVQSPKTGTEKLAPGSCSLWLKQKSKLVYVDLKLLFYSDMFLFKNEEVGYQWSDHYKMKPQLFLFLLCISAY